MIEAGMSYLTSPKQLYLQYKKNAFEELDRSVTTTIKLAISNKRDSVVVFREGDAIGNFYTIKECANLTFDEVRIAIYRQLPRDSGFSVRDSVDGGKRVIEIVFDYEVDAVEGR